MFDRSRVLRNADWQWLAALCVIALLASACGGEGDGDSGGAAVEGTSSPAAGDDGDSSDGASGDDGGSDDGGSDDGGGAGADRADDQDSGTADEGSQAPTEASTMPEEEAPASGPEPVYGGTLVFALESETTAGWNPITTSAATSGHIVLRQLYDPLVIEGVDGEAIPFLLESFSANEDHSEWTFTLRPGITFHDGLPVNSAALARHLEEMARGTLTRLAVEEAAVQSYEVIDDLSLKVIGAILVAQRLCLPNPNSGHQLWTCRRFPHRRGAG